MKCPRCGKESTGDFCSCGEPLTEETPKYYAEGVAHLCSEKQYAMARQLLNEGLERYPDSAMLWYNGGVLDEVTSNTQASIKKYQKACDLRPTYEKYWQALERAAGRKMPRPAAAQPAPTPPSAPPRAAAAEPTTQPFVFTMPDEPEPTPQAVATATPAPVSAAVVGELQDLLAGMDTPAPAAKPVANAPTPAPAASARANASPFDTSDAVPTANDAPATARPTAPLSSVDSFSSPGTGLALSASVQMWTLISKICGVMGIVSFIGFVVSLCIGEKAKGLITVMLLLFAVTVIFYFVGKALAPGKASMADRRHLAALNRNR